ncbi:hypothetical protein HID58_091610 [Brassica napus]|uniref:Uncharacterized protein n=1 Tax=Brassica napus TaxID=3708 RepID=A0ABQ7WZ97_BRANA|nr:hypothetical protein HID58_091610 [Brassica napus]
MEVLKGFPQDGCGWKSYFFYVRLDQASVAVECLPSFRRLWETGGTYTTPFLLFRKICGPLFWGHLAYFEDTSLSTVYAAGRSSGRGSLDAEEDGEPTVEDPIWMD